MDGATITAVIGAVTIGATTVIGAIAAAAIKVIHEIRQGRKKTDDELTSNGGSSMKDQLTRVDEAMARHIDAAKKNRQEVCDRLSAQDKAIEEIKARVCAAPARANYQSQTEQAPRVQT